METHEKRKEREQSRSVREEAEALVNELTEVPIKVELWCNDVTVCGCKAVTVPGLVNYIPGTSRFKLHDDLKEYIENYVRDLCEDNLRTCVQTVSKLCDTFSRRCEQRKANFLSGLLSGFIIGLVAALVGGFIIFK